VSVPRAEPVAESAPQNGRLTVDHLADPSEPVEVITIDALDVGCETELAREPHRHDYHELVWMRTGTGLHAGDDRVVSVAPGTVTLIGRGQVHVFAQAEGVSGAAVRFDAQVVHSASAGRADPTWLLAGSGGRVVNVPEDEVAALESTSAARSFSATCCRCCCCGSSAGMTPSAASVPSLTTLLSSSTAASRACSSATSLDTTTPRTTPTHLECRRRRCRRR